MSINSRDRVTSISDELAEYIVTDLRWDGSKDELIGKDAVELPAALDSTELLELAGFVEEKYGIEMSDEEIVAETFASVETLAQIVVAKQSGPETRNVEPITHSAG